MTKLQFLAIKYQDWIGSLQIHNLINFLWPLLTYDFCVFLFTWFEVSNSRLPDWVNFYSGGLFLHKICFNRNIADKLWSPKKFCIFNSIICLEQKKWNSNFSCPKLYKIARDLLFCPLCQTAQFYRWRCEINCTFRRWPSDIFGEKKLFYLWLMLLTEKVVVVFLY